MNESVRMKQAIWAHYRLQSALYLKERRDFPWGSVFFSEGIPDPEWNHAAALDLEAMDWDLARELFRSRDLPLTLTLGPLTGLVWRKTGFESSFRQVWHFAHEPPGDALNLGEGVKIKEVCRETEMQAFLDVFTSVYSVDLETGESDPLAAGYARSLRRSFEESRDDLRVVHYLATVGDRPAGVSTSIHGLTGEFRGISGLYNLAVHEGFRQQGLGGALVRRRAADARALGQEIIFLQTERASVERRLPRHGFVKGFVTEGWTGILTGVPAGGLSAGGNRISGGNRI